MKPQQLEKRLSNAYDAGYFDGYHDGIDDTHKIWVNELTRVNGIGPKLKDRILTHMTTELERRQAERGLAKNEEYREACETL